MLLGCELCALVGGIDDVQVGGYCTVVDADDEWCIWDSMLEPIDIATLVGSFRL